MSRRKPELISYRALVLALCLVLKQDPPPDGNHTLQFGIIFIDPILELPATHLIRPASRLTHLVARGFGASTEF